MTIPYLDCDIRKCMVVVVGAGIIHHVNKCVGGDDDGVLNSCSSFLAKNAMLPNAGWCGRQAGRLAG